MTIEGELDDISGAGQTRAAHGLCIGIPRERQWHYDVEGAGHYGIFSGRRWREKVYPQVRDFIAANQGDTKQPVVRKLAAPRKALAVAAAKQPAPRTTVVAKKGKKVVSKVVAAKPAGKASAKRAASR